MTTFLDELTVRHQEASRELQAAQVQLQFAQNKFNQASQRTNALAVILAGEQQRIAREQALERARVAAARIIAPMAENASHPASTPAPPAPEALVPTPAATQPVASDTDAPTKTELVRAILGRHPKGITPNELWKQLKNPQISSVYVHSVLHRLKERDEVGRRNHKYFLKTPQPHAEEVAAQNGVVEMN
jgi:hypothetical protein